MFLHHDIDWGSVTWLLQIDVLSVWNPKIWVEIETFKRSISSGCKEVISSQISYKARKIHLWLVNKEWLYFVFVKFWIINLYNTGHAKQSELCHWSEQVSNDPESWLQKTGWCRTNIKHDSALWTRTWARRPRVFGLRYPTVQAFTSSVSIILKHYSLQN